MSIIDPKKLRFWLDKRYNVLFEGLHGVGKTSIILEAFEEAGLSYAYFSGATLDPFIDFCGVPIKVDTDDGSYIELIRPKHLADRKIQAIFIDEYNRSHKKIRNATMELIQFKTINKQKIFDDLRVIWVAINPDSEEDNTYDTDRLDPAQRDRFQIHQQIPYAVDFEYFAKKYGELNAKAAKQWWDELPDKEKQRVSPRRLDYAVQLFLDNGDVRDVLPHSTLPGTLSNALAIGPAELKLNSLLSDPEAARKYLAIDNNYKYSIKTIISNTRFMSAFIPILPKEKINALYAHEQKVKQHMLSDIKSSKANSPYVQPLMEIAQANQNQEIGRAIRDELEKVGITATPKEIKCYYAKNVTTKREEIDELMKMNTAQTYNRSQLYKKLVMQVGMGMDKDTAKSVIAVVNKLSSANEKTMDRDMPHLMSIGNYAILCMLKDGMPLDEADTFVENMRKFRKRRCERSCPTVAEISRYLAAQEQMDKLKATV